MKLHLAEGLSLPLEVVTEKLAFLGRTGTGKTYAAMKLAELMLHAGAQIIALDAVGKWYGLRVDGLGPGFPIPVFGGLPATRDFPLEATGGKLMADVLVDRSLSAVLDVSQFTHGEQTRFAFDFGTQFFQRKKASPGAVHLFLEECQEFMPQNAMPGEQAMLSAFERLWKLGRNFGIGGSLISQRPQEINKKGLNQAGTLFVFQMTGPQERKAIELWVSAQGIDENIADVLPTLQQGQPHVWSPTFLQCSKTVRIREKQTADVSITPKVGASAKARPLTPIDAEQLKTQMAATVERAKAEDPKELRRQIAGLQRDLAEARRAQLVQAPQVEHVEVPVPAISDEVISRLKEVTLEWVLHRQQVQAAVDEVVAGIEKIVQHGRTIRVAATARRHEQPWSSIDPNLTSRRPESKVNKQPKPLNGLGRREADGNQIRGGKFRDMLVALAQAGRPLSDSQVTARAGMALSGTFDKYLGQMRTAGWVEGPRTALAITSAGLAALGDYEPLPEGRALQDYWLQKLGNGKKRNMLGVLIDVYPKRLTAEEVAGAADMALSGTFDKYIGQLRTLQLVTGSRSDLRASDELFA